MEGTLPGPALLNGPAPGKSRRRERRMKLRGTEALHRMLGAGRVSPLPGKFLTQLKSVLTSAFFRYTAGYFIFIL